MVVKQNVYDRAQHDGNISAGGKQQHQHERMHQSNDADQHGKTPWSTATKIMKEGSVRHRAQLASPPIIGNAENITQWQQ